MSQPLVLPGSHTHSLPLELSPAVVPVMLAVVVVLVPSSVVVAVIAVSVAAVVVVVSPVVEVVPPTEPWVVSPLVGVVVGPLVVAPEVVSPALGSSVVVKFVVVPWAVVVGVPPSSLQASGAARRSTRGRRGERVDRAQSPARTPLLATLAECGCSRTRSARPEFTPRSLFTLPQPGGSQQQCRHLDRADERDERRCRDL